MDIKNIALTVGIAILTTLFIVFLIDALYEMPKYENFCNDTFYPLQPIKAEPLNCTPLDIEQMSQQCYRNEGEVRFKYDANGCQEEAYCDYCVKEFNEVNSGYNRNIFYISALIALIIIVMGLYLPKKLDSISSGLIFAGVLILTQGTFRVFLDLDKFPRVLILGIELAILIWIGYKRIINR